MTALIALVMSWLPTLAAGAAPLGLVMGFLPKLVPSWQMWLRIGSLVMGAIAVAGAVVHYMNLRADSVALHQLVPKIAALETSLGCPGRSPQERELFACIPARDRDAAAATADAVRRAAQASVLAQADLAQKAEQLQSDLNAADDAVADAADADDGPVPKVMRDNWARERAKRGMK